MITDYEKKEFLNSEECEFVRECINKHIDKRISMFRGDTTRQSLMEAVEALHDLRNELTPTIN